MIQRYHVGFNLRHLLPQHAAASGKEKYLPLEKYLYVSEAHVPLLSKCASCTQLNREPVCFVIACIYLISYYLI